MPDKFIELRHIAKFHGDRPVLTDVSLTGRSGEFHLVLGANGAGKSTLLRIMAGLSTPASGTIAHNGRQAYLGHQTFLYPRLSALENLRFQARINHIATSEARLMRLLDLAGLKFHAHEPAGVFSRGMAQRLNFCRTLLLEPDLFLLDEPFTGMDAASRKLMAGELARRRDQGACIVMVSHAPAEDAPEASHCHTLAKGRLAQDPAC